MRIKKKKLTLQHEVEIYKALQGNEGIPKLFWYGREGKYNLMVMELLGKSLESVLTLSKGKLSVRAVLTLGEQMV